MGPRPASREVREYATEFGIRPELRFNDLRGTKVTEMVWSGISVPDLAIRIGWKIETAAKMLGVYAALNPAAPRWWPSPTARTTPPSRHGQPSPLARGRRSRERTRRD